MREKHFFGILFLVQNPLIIRKLSNNYKTEKKLSQRIEKVKLRRILCLVLIGVRVVLYD